MSQFDHPPRAKRAWCDDDMLWVEFVDGRQLGVPLAYFPRLLRAAAQRRAKVVLSGGGAGLRWEELDEDISVPALLAQQLARENRITP